MYIYKTINRQTNYNCIAITKRNVKFKLPCMHADCNAQLIKMRKQF